VARHHRIHPARGRLSRRAVKARLYDAIAASLGFGPESAPAGARPAVLLQPGHGGWKPHEPSFLARPTL
jgi:hypothetical protein